MIRKDGTEVITDGRFYRENDMVRIDANGCSGCSACCRFAEDTIVLDPLDVFNLTLATGESFQSLVMKKRIALRVENGVILPVLAFADAEDAPQDPAFEARMEDGRKVYSKQIKPGVWVDYEPYSKACTFLNKEGRCEIHERRPGFCRLFPLGRMWEEKEDGNFDFKFIFQPEECVMGNRTKVKVADWVGIKDAASYRNYHIKWHTFLSRFRKALSAAETDEQQKSLSMYVLKNFFDKPYVGAKEEMFMKQFAMRLKQAEAMFHE